jgi:hypothetical protein
MDVSDGALSGVLLGTAHGTLIKRKAVQRPSFGVQGRFSPERHRRALEILRESASPEVCRPGRECDCSHEFEAVDGKIAWTPHAADAPRLAELFAVHPVVTRAAAIEFLRDAARTLLRLNRLGVSHGDPAFSNFAVGRQTVLIDLDECAYTGESESVWDQSVFLHSTVAPMLGEFLAPGEMVEFAQSAMPGAGIFRAGLEALAPTVAAAVEQHRSARVMRFLALQNRALQVQVAETGAKLGQRVREVERQSDVYLAAAEERLRALEAAHVEMDALRIAASERERALLEAHAEMSRLREADEGRKR